MKHKRVQNAYNWLPMDKRLDRLGLPLPPRKPELRKPLLWLESDGHELYLVNLTDEILDYVNTTTAGYQTCDDDVLTISHDEKYLYQYKDVLPNEAVKVEEYDGYYDLDFVLQVYLDIKSPSLGHLRIASPSEKGGIGECVLLWNNGESGKYVSIIEQEDSDD